MSATDVTQAPTGGGPSGTRDRLSARVLPRWAPVASGAVALVLGLGSWATGVTVIGLAPSVIAVLAFFIIYATWTLGVEGRRHAVDRLATSLVYGTAVLALVPLLWILITVTLKGLSALSLSFVTETMRNVNPRAQGGGVAHAIIGTLEQVGIAALLSVPIGILTAVYLVEYGRGRLAKSINFFVDVMTGIPSIVAGMFIFTFWILLLGFPTSGFAGALALSILMVPVIVRSSEEMLRIVPNELRQGALALGVPKYKVVVSIVLPTALSGLLTGVMLAVARVTGETAPLLLTTFLAQNTNANPLSGPQASLPTFIWDQISRGTVPALDRAWGGAFILILIVLVFYATARILAVRYAPKSR